MARIMCEVPFCGRSTAGNPDRGRWICADHWRLTQPVTRRLFRRAQRRGRHEVEANLFGYLVRQAVEASAGIG